MLLSMAACERPVGDPSPVAMPGTSDGPAVEIQEQPADTVESQPTKFTTKDATSRATRVSTLPSTQESMGPAESRVVPCYLPTAYSSVDGNLQWAPEAFVEWSPVGAEILYNEWHNLYGVAADGLLVRHVARTSQPEPPPRERILSFDIARDGRRVVYSACEYMGQRPEFRIVTTGIDGTQVRRFAVGDYLDIYPAWSPDGRRIALLRGHRRLSRGKIAMLVTMSADGTEQRTVEMSLDRLALWPPEWSPNGERIAFVGLRDGDSGWGLHTVGYDGGDVKRLTDTLSGPEWSPDGERIAFAKADGEEAAIYTIAADGTDLRRVTTIPGWDAERLVPEPSRRRIHTVEWSPDGSKILFIDDLLLEHDGRWAWGDPEGGPGGVYVVGADGSGLVRVLDMCLVTRTLGRERTLEVVSYTAAGWSPDGTRIAVSIDFNLKSTRDGSEVHILLLTMDPDGSNRRVLAHGSRVNMTALGSEPTRPYAAPRACAEGLVITNPEANAGLVADCETLLGIRDKLAGAGDAAVVRQRSDERVGGSRDRGHAAAGAWAETLGTGVAGRDTGRGKQADGVAGT